MSIPDRYFHNRSILLLLIINSILLIVGTLLIVFRLDSDTTTNYIVQRRANLGIGEYEIGKALDMATFIFFMVINFVLCVLISVRSFGLRKPVAVMILTISMLVTLLTIIVSNHLMAIS
jgi:uncharacterized membrane protein (UPF0136 family)